MATAIITGASNGIGRELAKIHASKGDNLVLVARNVSSLQLLKIELEKSFKISIWVIGKDLSKINSAMEVFEEVKSKNIKIDYLINNAGFGNFGLFTETDWGKRRANVTS
jgi:short-subunit dehydrogenase